MEHMAGYTKLFNSILASTIWRADHVTRIVWITLLAMADRHGVAEGSIPGLADFARVTIAECESALTQLQAPDTYSRSQEHEGRRIQAVDGGWLILNHAKYRAKLGADERREYLRVKQAEYRQSHPRKKIASTVVNNGNDWSTLLTHTEAEADPESEKIKIPRASRSASAGYDEDFLQIWALYPKGSKSQAAKEFTRARLSDPNILGVMLAAIGWQSQQPNWTEQGGKFRPDTERWIKNRRWEDEPSNISAERPRSLGPDYSAHADWWEDCKQRHGMDADGVPVCRQSHYHTLRMATEAAS